MAKEKDKYLFNSRGEWIAFRRGKYVFDVEGNWIGWQPRGTNDVYDMVGKYVGTIVGDRFYLFINKIDKVYAGYPGYPPFPGYSGYPGFRDFSPLPS